MMRGKLNIFQRTVLLWNEMHPYNAVHVVRISRPLNTEKLKAVIDHILERHGLVNLVIDPARKRYDYRGGSSGIEIELAPGNEHGGGLESEIQKQLNLPFATTGSINPFRFFVISEGDGFYLGLVYFHMIAGADSIITLMKEIMHAYSGEKITEPHLPFDLYPKVYRKLMPLSCRYLARWIATFGEHISHMRRSCRPKYHDMDYTGTGFASLYLSPQQCHTVIRMARIWGVTVNDLFLALLLKSLAPMGSKRFRSIERGHISVASIVNIRKDLSVDAGVFGIFLSYFNVTHPVPEGISIEQLAKDVHTQTEKIKKYRLFLRTVFEMWAAFILVSGIFRKRKKSFYAKYNPIWGGITNVNLNAIWPSSGGEAPVYYLRAVSTGHATPLVFSFTTLHDKIFIGVSYRRTVFSEESMGKIFSDFSECISALAEVNRA
ncbi:MAG: hypothetical protein C4538_10120 [Nitrospiraceae bacterium]|nr:MAG: hypothetical protein C4538_10120 [Nitrospiraceae bacterium]